MPWNMIAGTYRTIADAPDLTARFIYWLCGSTVARLVVVVGLTSVAVVGSYLLMPPIDYLPRGNRNIVFGLLIPPPGYNMDQQVAMAKRIEAVVEPYWEAAKLEPGSEARAEAERNLPSVPTFNYMTGQPGDPVVPPSLENYFVVGRENTMFHGGIATNGDRIVDVVPLFAKATSPARVPGVLAFAFQLPLFRLGGSTGSAVKIDFSGDDLSEVAGAATAVMVDLFQIPGAQVQPSPSNFNIFGPEIRLIPNARRLADLGLTPTDLGLAVQANGDGAIIGEYRIGGDSIDLKLIASSSVDRTMIQGFEDIPIATPTGNVVPLSTLAEIRRVTSPPQINHVARQRSVTLQLTPPPGMPLQEAVDRTAEVLQKYRDSGVIPPTVQTGFAGSASKLESVRNAMLGDGSFLGTMSSSLMLALVVVYLLMCVLFQSFAQPLIIMFSVPLATLGGFMALFAVFLWSVNNRYMPMQSLDVLTMLGFIILIGTVVNNAILVVHQSLNHMREDGMAEREAIRESTRTRIRPIFMSVATSVFGMLPLVLFPGAGSELYRGLG
ncbi:MAG: efflux RND transporter permease subunit, partial [Phycisphaerales bacterium]|nr:efflux RND transporter permease subunit [Phycisphaerales bacterium]